MVIDSGPSLGAEPLSCPVQIQANGQKQGRTEKKDSALPVTLLSGFLVSRPDRQSKGVTRGVTGVNETREAARQPSWNIS